jgi:hypothetical protein
MTNKKYNDKNIKPNGGIPFFVDEQPVARGIDGFMLPKIGEYAAFAIPEIINASHLFVVDGQECICLTDTIPEKTKMRSMPR